MARDATCWTVEGMRKRVLKNTGVDYSVSHVRKIMKKWGYAMKAPVGRHVNRAGKGAHTPVPEEGERTRIAYGRRTGHVRAGRDRSDR